MKGLFQHEDILSLEPLLNELKNKKLFITGGTGYVGKCLLDLLLRANQILNLNLKINLLTRNQGKFLKDFPLALETKNINFIEQDINEGLDNLLIEDLDFVIHAATAASSQERISLLKEPAEKLLKNTINNTKNIISLCKRKTNTKCLYISSGAVYDKIKNSEKLRENDYSLEDLYAADESDVYTLGKILSEKVFHEARDKDGFINFNIARCFSFIGPYLPIDSNLVGSNFFYNIVSKEPITIQGHGSETRSFMHSYDLAIWLINILMKGHASETYNVGSDKEITISEFAKKISQHFQNYEICIKKLNTNTSRRQYYIPDLSKAKEELNLNFKYENIEQCIANTAKWYEL